MFLNWKPDNAGGYTLYAMAIGGVGDLGDHYTVGEPLTVTVTEQDIAAFQSENVLPSVQLINYGIKQHKSLLQLLKWNWVPYWMKLMKTIPKWLG